MALLAADSFNRADNASSLGSTDGAGLLDPVAWIPQLGTWGISSNQAYKSGGSSAEQSAVIDAGTADVIVEVTTAARNFANGAGLVFRAVDFQNFWLARNSSAGNTQLIRVINGIEAPFGGNQPGAADGHR